MPKVYVCAKKESKCTLLTEHTEGFGGDTVLDYRWVVSRQMRFEGGFQGRCNKLVDGCYSFWQAGLLPLLHRAFCKEGSSALSEQRWMFEQQALQEYILLCCQNPSGGLVDKPGKARDFYHTCYCLSGLSIAQHFGNLLSHHELILGKEDNRLVRRLGSFNMCVEFLVTSIIVQLCPSVYRIKTSTSNSKLTIHVFLIKKFKCSVQF
uniref:Prenyltransferase alpha-alpha toroid domain-containing protein n=1 Tax=Periophthalmus magnuspinnatus TaxID=409849 RepID=A0A3B3Z849_9GOBI